MGRSITTTNYSTVGNQLSKNVFGTGNYKVFYYSDTFTLPTGVNAIRVRCWGAGGGGASGQGNSGSGNGGIGGSGLVVVEW
jgi:hypothetical protein